MLTKEQAKASLCNIIEALRDAENGYSHSANSAKLAEAMATAGNDMLKRMQLVYPILTKIQIDVIRSQGFSGDIEGLMKFCQEIAQLERDDTEIKKLNDDLREIFLPRIPGSVMVVSQNGK